MAKQRKRATNTKMRAHTSPPKKLAAAFYSEMPLKQLLITTPVLIIITVIIVILSRSFLPPQVPLFYGLPEGEEQLVSSISLIIPSLVSLAIYAINTAFVYFIKDKFVQSTLVVAAFAISLLASITTIKIIVLVNSFAW